MFGRKERVLNGIYSSSLALWSYLPTECPNYQETACGIAKTKLTKPFRKLFGMPKGTAAEEVKISVYVNDGGVEKPDEAKIFAALGNNLAIFTVKSSVRDENGSGRFRSLRLERRLVGQNPEAIQITKRDIYYQAFEDLIELGMKNGLTRVSWCGGCPAEENGLPRTVT